jgi:hypothetical protein
VEPRGLPGAIGRKRHGAEDMPAEAGVNVWKERQLPRLDGSTHVHRPCPPSLHERRARPAPPAGVVESERLERAVHRHDLADDSARTATVGLMAN